MHTDRFTILQTHVGIAKWN